MDQLLHELGIILVPGIEESQLAVGVVRFDRQDTGELRRAVPDKFVGYGDFGRALPFTQHELKAAGPGVLMFFNRIRPQKNVKRGKPRGFRAKSALLIHSQNPREPSLEIVRCV